MHQRDKKMNENILRVQHTRININVLRSGRVKGEVKTPSDSLEICTVGSAHLFNSLRYRSRNQSRHCKGTFTRQL